MTITKVVIYNEDDREGHENYGKKEKMEITGKAFAYIVREAMDFRQLFNFINSQGDWVEMKK